MLNKIRLSPQLLLAGVVGILALLIIFIATASFFYPTAPVQKVQEPTHTPAPISSMPITKEERRYPQATPQPFRHSDAKQTGTLVVTSSVEGTDVLLDTSSHPHAPDEPIPPGQIWPHNTTPFKVESMPVGEHTLEAVKIPGYDMVMIHYLIKEDEVTRVHIELTPFNKEGH